MKVAHWILGNTSGMSNVARSIVAAEVALGLNSVVAICTEPTAYDAVADADIHVIHTHAPDAAIQSGKPMIWVAHGTPEVMFHSGYEQGLVAGGYGHGDAWMMAQFWLQHCDATVTFWPRHAQIWKSLCDKRSLVACIPMGIDKEFWSPQKTEGKFAGSPSVFTAENCYEIKWPLDLFIAWPWVTTDPALRSARLHALYVPKDQHRWWFPLVNRNGCSFHAHISAMVFNPDQLRNAFCSTDFFIGLVRYGDFNRLSLEAAASGVKTISYSGNQFADYWIPEGDQRDIARNLIAILSGKVQPREKASVPASEETAKAMKAIYEAL